MNENDKKNTTTTTITINLGERIFNYYLVAGSNITDRLIGD